MGPSSVSGLHLGTDLKQAPASNCTNHRSVEQAKHFMQLQ